MENKKDNRNSNSNNSININTSSPDKEPLYTTVGSLVGGSSSTPLNPPSRRARAQGRNDITPQQSNANSRLLLGAPPYGLNISPRNSRLSSQDLSVPSSYAPIQQNEERAVSPDLDDRGHIHDPFYIPSPPNPLKSSKSSKPSKPTKHSVTKVIKTTVPSPAGPALHRGHQLVSHHQSASTAFKPPPSGQTSSHQMKSTPTRTIHLPPTYPTATNDNVTSTFTSQGQTSLTAPPNTSVWGSTTSHLSRLTLQHSVSTCHPAVGAVDPNEEAALRLEGALLQEHVLKKKKELLELEADMQQKMGSLGRDPHTGASNATNTGHNGMPFTYPQTPRQPYYNNIGATNSNAPPLAPMNRSQPATTRPQSTATIIRTQPPPGFQNRCGVGTAAQAPVARTGYHTNTPPQGYGNTSSSILAKGPGAPRPLTAGPPGLRRLESSGLQELASRSSQADLYGLDSHARQAATDDMRARMHMQQQHMSSNSNLATIATSSPMSRGQFPPTPITNTNSQKRAELVAGPRPPVSQLPIFKTGSLCKITDTLTREQVAKYYPSGIYPPNFNNDEDIQPVPDNWTDYYPRKPSKGGNMRREAMMQGWKPTKPIIPDTPLPLYSQNGVGEEMFGKRHQSPSYLAPGPSNNLAISDNWSTNATSSVKTGQPTAKNSNWGPSWLKNKGVYAQPSPLAESSTRRRELATAGSSITLPHKQEDSFRTKGPKDPQV